jgi:hypothetical protein
MHCMPCTTDSGFDDVLYAVPITTDKLTQAAALTDRMGAFHIIIDHEVKKTDNPATHNSSAMISSAHACEHATRPCMGPAVHEASAAARLASGRRMWGTKVRVQRRLSWRASLPHPCLAAASPGRCG